MDFETSFEEYTVTGVASKFIALEVSDHEDDYNSSMDSFTHETASIITAAVREGSDNTNVEMIHDVKFDSRPGSVCTSAAPSTPHVQADMKHKGEEKKKWSFISSSSSSKKRWSTISYASDAHSKRISITSSSSSIKSNKTATPSSLKLKRSSTGASLRSLLNKISLNDKIESSAKLSGSNNSTYSGVGLTAGRNGGSVSSKGSCLPNKEVMDARSRKLGSIASSNFRVPLKPLSSNVSMVNRSHAPHPSTIDSASITSQTSASSIHSKWKFWKGSKLKDDCTNNYLWNNNTPPSSVSSGASARSRSSFSDLRKSIFASNALSTSAQDLCRGASTNLKHRLSQNSLKQMPSHSSLKTKNSHSSLKKFRRGSNSEESPQISLPIPDQASRDKIRVKLKHSASLISINNSDVFGTPIIAESKEYDEVILKQVLELCAVKEVQSFSVLPTGLHKISNEKVYLNKEDNTIYKILSFPTEGESLMGKDMLLKELQLQSLLSGTPGFVDLLDCGVYVQAESGSQFLVFHMKNHGIPLSTMTSITETQACGILAQCIRCLYVAETKYQFEHRFLTSDHILIDNEGNVTLCDYRLARASYESNTWFTRLDNPVFFQGRRDYNYVLQWMRSLMNSQNWHLHHPRTNLYWLHYIIEKMLGALSDAAPGKQKLLKVQAMLDPLKRRKLWKRSDTNFETCGDLVGHF